jgi:hypothetical protein
MQAGRTERQCTAPEGLCGAPSCLLTGCWVPGLRESHTNKRPLGVSVLRSSAVINGTDSCPTDTTRVKRCQWRGYKGGDRGIAGTEVGSSFV